MTRTEVSRRLKAARWLAGGEGDDGKPRAVTTRELAEHPLLRENGITANRIEEIEQMKISPPPMELQTIAIALEVPSDWFASAAGGASQLDRIEAMLNQNAARMQMIVEQAERVASREAVIALGEAIADQAAEPASRSTDTADTQPPAASRPAAPRARGRGTRAAD